MRAYNDNVEFELANNTLEIQYFISALKNDPFYFKDMQDEVWEEAKTYEFMPNFEQIYYQILSEKIENAITEEFERRFKDSGAKEELEIKSGLSNDYFNKEKFFSLKVNDVEVKDSATLDIAYKNAFSKYENSLMENEKEDFTILETERDNFFKEIEAADLLRNKLLEHKKNIDSNQNFSTYNYENKAIATALTFFRDENIQRSISDITLELNLISPNLSKPLTERDVRHLKTLSYLCEEGAVVINYNAPKTMNDIDKELNNIIDLKNFDEEITSILNDVKDKNTDNKTKVRRQ